MAYCAKCGGQLQEQAKFCPSCGAPAQAAQANPGPSAGPAAGPSQQQAGPQQQAYQQAGPQQQAYQQAGPQQQTYQQAPPPPPVQPRVYQPDGDPRTLAIGARTVFAYMGIFLLIPLLVDKTSRFARFHAGQGLNLLIFGVGYSIVQWILVTLLTLANFYVGMVMGIILNIAGLWIPAFTILGIVWVCTAQMKPLPIPGKLEIIKV